MPPRVQLPSSRLLSNRSTQYICLQCRLASLASATTPAPPIEHAVHAAPPIARYPRTQPPSYKPPEFRKSQLLRQYQSLLRSSPLMVIFQHNNLKATEWMGIRRELAAALQKVDEELAKTGNSGYVGSDVKLQVVQTGIFASAVKVVEFWDPNFEESASAVAPSDPQVASSFNIQDKGADSTSPTFRHGLSVQAWKTAKAKSRQLQHGLEPLLSGPLAVLTFPSVSPQHLKAALSILSPSPQFPAPKRKANPGYHSPDVQNGLHKLILLAARVEGKVFDTEGTRWVGGIEGGLDGLRGQLVAMLQGFGAGLTNALEAASKSLYVTVESRRVMLEEEKDQGQGKREDS